ncbi:alpha-galactosidase [Microbacterium hominis]|uniref:alpha-galactosidase n=1 Tax=Microbacterium hominis TaxID=162426 RepID=UPI0020B78310|nr:alpha-galactosidase [Microbacterium hominis]
MIHHLRAAGVSVVVDARGAGVPVVLHWGRDLGPLDDEDLAALAAASTPAVPPSSIDVPFRLTLAAGLGDGWTGRPALQFSRRGDTPAARAARAPRLRAVRERREDRAEASALRMTVRDDEAAVTVELDLELTAQGLLRSRATVHNDGVEPLDLAAAGILLPIPARAGDLLDFTGLWARERRPIRGPLRDGIHARESRHGRGGHDNAFVLAAGTPGFSFEAGEVWAVHAAWSGDTAVWAERSALGPSTLAAQELLAPGEVVVDAGRRHTGAWSVAVYSAEGLNGISDRTHAWVRSWQAPPPRPRPLTLNTWEAVYFDQSLEKLEPLIAAAAEVGVERFVLDDGWFLGRRDDRRALGDWTVDPQVWPQGLGPLVERVHAAGMQFGLWVEPEMISADSALAREHPEWMLGRGGDLEWRFQRALDLSAPGAADHVFECLDALLRTYDIAFLKWDHNRDLLHARAHAQTAAVYALIDRLRAAHPGVEIESCASGGARLDIGMLPHVDRVWPSDCNDPVERQRIHAWTTLLLPPEYLGAHVGAPEAHTTGRTAATSFRLGTALFGSAGIEWNVAQTSEGERAQLAAWADEYRRRRDLLHSGRVVRIDTDDPAVVAHGVVAHDRSEALFSVATVDTPAAALPPALRFPGLDADARYRVAPVPIADGPRIIADQDPPWYRDGGIELPGRLLAETGLPMPLLAPEQLLLLEFTRL